MNNKKACRELKVLVIGATGAGKSSLINLFYCWSKGWNLSDVTSIKEVQIKTKYFDGDCEAEGDVQSQDQSQTKIAKLYQFHLAVPHEDTKYFLNFLDTPGIGDVGGIAKDEQNVELILEAASKTEDLNAIVLMLNGAEARNHSRIQYIIKKLQAVIPNGMSRNLMVLLSNVDLQPNINVKALFDFPIDSSQIYWYNNQTFNLPPEYFNDKNIISRCQQVYDESIDTIYNMLKKIASLPTITTKDFSNMQDLKDKFKMDVVGFGETLYQGYIKEAELKKMYLEIEKGSLEVSKLEHPLDVATEEMWKLVKTQDRNTICCSCKKTCHNKCSFAVENQGGKHVKDCYVFDYGRITSCQHCGHSYTSHTRQYGYYEKDTDQMIRMQQQTKKAIEATKEKNGSKMATTKAITAELEKIVEERKILKNKILGLVPNLRKICSRFDYITQIDNCIKIFQEKLKDVEMKGSEGRSLKDVQIMEALKDVERLMEKLKIYIIKDLKNSQNKRTEENLDEELQGNRKPGVNDYNTSNILGKRSAKEMPKRASSCDAKKPTDHKASSKPHQISTNTLTRGRTAGSTMYSGLNTGSSLSVKNGLSIHAQKLNEETHTDQRQVSRHDIKLQNHDYSKENDPVRANLDAQNVSSAENVERLEEEMNLLAAHFKNIDLNNKDRERLLNGLEKFYEETNKRLRNRERATSNRAEKKISEGSRSNVGVSSSSQKPCKPPSTNFLGKIRDSLGNWKSK